jgi:hypothetical protein
MAALITRTRELINDLDETPTWTDDQIQNVLDAGRQDYRSLLLKPEPTWTSGAIQYLDYYAPFGDWETDWTFSQNYITTVTPSSTEPVVGRITFAESTFPTVYIAFGKSYDLYRAAADLLERQAAQWLTAYNVTANGQTMQRSQVAQAMRDLARQYRGQQRARSICMSRSDGNRRGQRVSLKASPVDYITTG